MSKVKSDEQATIERRKKMYAVMKTDAADCIEAMRKISNPPEHITNAIARFTECITMIDNAVDENDYTFYTGFLISNTLQSSAMLCSIAENMPKTRPK